MGCEEMNFICVTQNRGGGAPVDTVLNVLSSVRSGGFLH